MKFIGGTLGHVLLAFATLSPFAQVTCSPLKGRLFKVSSYFSDGATDKQNGGRSHELINQLGLRMIVSVKDAYIPDGRG